MVRYNRNPNPAFDNNLTGWSSANTKATPVRQGGSPAGTYARPDGGLGYVIDARSNGSTKAQIWTTGTAGMAAVTPGQTYTVSVYVYHGATVARDVRLDARMMANSTTSTVSSTISATTRVSVNVWTRITATVTADVGENYLRTFVEFITNATSVDNTYVALSSTMVEDGSSSPNYRDGESSGWMWNGTAGSSISQESTIPQYGGDSGTGSETGAVTSSPAGADSGLGSETGYVAVPRTGSDTGHGSETGKVDPVKPEGVDVGHGSEGSASIGATTTGGDSGHGSEAAHVDANTTGGDSGQGSGGAGFIVLPGSDAGHGHEALDRLHADVANHDQGSGAEGGYVETRYGDLVISLYAVDPATGKLIALPDYTSLSMAPERNGPGSISVTYPSTGQNFALLRDAITADRDLEIEIWNLGSTTGALRGYLQESSGDDVSEGKVTWTFAGGFLEIRMAEAIVWPQPLVGVPTLGENVAVPYGSTTEAQWDRLRALGYVGNSSDGIEQLYVPSVILAAVKANAVSIPVLADPKRELKFNAATVGEIGSFLLSQARARGALTDIAISFSVSKDSKGTPWPTVVTTKYSPGATYESILNSLASQGRVEWSLTWNGTARVLNLYVPSGRGIDRTLGTQPVVLRAGRNLSQSPRKWSLRSSATAMLGIGSEGAYADTSNLDAQTRRGRRIESSTSSNTLTTIDSVLSYAQRRLSTKKDGTLEVSHGLSMLPGEPRPLVAFDIGDWVYSQTSPTMERIRVVGWSITSDANRQLTCTVTLNDVQTTATVRQQQELDALSSGETVAGTSTPPTDTGVPLAPDLPVVGSDAFDSGLGEIRASVSVDWAGVTLNTDGSACTDLDGYKVQWKLTNGPAWLDAGDIDSPPLFFTAPPASSIHVRVQAYDRSGNRSLWSNEAVHITDDDTTPPGVPSTPTVSDYLGMLDIAWDGKTNSGADMLASYLDFYTVQVHMSTTSGFTPSAATQIGELRGAGRWVRTDLPYGVTQFVRLVAVDRRGNVSAVSAQASAVPAKVVNLDLGPNAVERANIKAAAIGNAQIDVLAVNDANIGSLNAGKITAGIMTAAMTVSGSIQTALTGARVQLDSTGFRCVNAAGQDVLAYSIATGSMTMTGTFQTGRTGQRAVLSGTTGSLRFYPDDDETRWGEIVGFVPANYPNSIAMQITSSTAAGQDNIGTLSVMPGLTTISTTSPTNVSNYFARTSVQRDTISMAFGTGTANNAQRGGTLFLSRYSGSNGGVTEFGYYNDSGLLMNRVTLYADGGVTVGSGGNNYLSLTNSSAALVQGGFVKSFIIDHPDDPDRWLVHGCTESPTAGVEYWGEAVIRDGHAWVELPGYFESLTLLEGRQVQLTPIGAPVLCAATRPRNGKFMITSNARDGQSVAWLVKASRRDVGLFDPEPLRTDIDVRGTGPYKYFTKR